MGSQGMGVGQSQTCRPPPSPQAILPLMKFLEVKLCYMNTNLVQENFSRYAAASRSVPPPPRPSSLASAIFRGGCNQPLLKCSLLETGSSLLHTPAHFPSG